MYKSKFVPAQNTYLLNHSVGRMPVNTREVVEAQFFDVWQNSQPDAWAGWFPIFNEFNQALASLFNSDARQFCPQQNVSSAIAKLVASMPTPAAEKNVILLTKNDFPSVGFALQQAEKSGYQIRYMPEGADPQDATCWEEALTEDVACALLTHVHFNTSKRAPVGAITSLTRQRQIFSIVDIAQSSGVVPIDFQQWQADAVVGSCVKWLCGGSGAGFLWLDAAQITRLHPTDVGWFSHRDPFEFNIDNFEYADNALRFWGGTPSVIPYIIATNSIKNTLEIGVDVIHQHNQDMIDLIVRHLDQAWLVSPKERAKRGGTLVLNLDGFKEARALLKQNNVMHDERELGARFSPHIYNDRDEMELMIQCLR